MKTGKELFRWAQETAENARFSGGGPLIASAIATAYLTGANDALTQEIAWHKLQREEHERAEANRDRGRG